MPIVDYDDQYDTPWYAGGAGGPAAPADLVPSLFCIAINGHPYVLNTDPNAIQSYGDYFHEESVPLLRAQADQSDEFGEQSLSSEGFSRRSQGSWHAGAGQTVLDRKESDSARFYTSKGVDPWTKYELSLLNSTSSLDASGEVNQFMCSAAGAAYWTQGETVQLSTNLSSVSTVTGTSTGEDATSIATNGKTVWVSFGSNGVDAILGSSGSNYISDPADLVGYAKGRLLVAQGNSLFNPITSGALPSSFFDHPDSDFTWRCFAEGSAVIYIAGDLGDRSYVYRSTIQDDGTGLDSAVVAATLPAGEVVRSMLGYFGYLILGTDKGVRFSTADVNGDLTLGALIPTTSGVFALEAQDRFVWFGWSDYDGTSTGLGRLDLTIINDALVPAYASDLMATTGGVVQGLATVGTKRVFSVNGHGIYKETSTPVASGTLTTGQITYGIADPKVFIGLGLKHAPLPSGTSISVSVLYDRTTPAESLGSSSAAGSVSPAENLAMGKRRAEEVELTFTLTASGSNEPMLTRWTMMALPAPRGASVFTLPLLLHERIQAKGETEWPFENYDEYQYLVSLHGDRSVATVQIDKDTWEGVLDDFVWIPEHHTQDQRWWDGTFVAKFRRVRV